MLTDLQCRKASCPEGAARLRLTDSGGLYLELRPSGGKLWRWKYRFNKVEKMMALGSYPAVSLAAARAARDAAKLQKTGGLDPMVERKRTRTTPAVLQVDTFKGVASEWLSNQTGVWSEGHELRCRRQLERDLYPALGSRRLGEIRPPELLAEILKLEARGINETAARALMLAGQIWRYGVATGRVQTDITIGLKGALKPFRKKHFGAITDPKELAILLRAIRAYRGSLAVRAGLQLAPMLFQRPGELRAAAWNEIDMEGALWTIPAARMKRGTEGKRYGEPHYVPLPAQAIAILTELKKTTGAGTLVFPGERCHDRPISDNSIRTALISMGYSSDTQTWHGFRATARTMLAEQLEYDPLVIEAQLAHSVKDVNGRAYNRTTYLVQRKQMMQGWADFLEKLERGV